MQARRYPAATPNQIRIPATPGKIGAPPVFAAMPPGMPRETSADALSACLLTPRRRFQAGDIDFAHQQHRFRDPPHTGGVRIVHQFGQAPRHDLPA